MPLSPVKDQILIRPISIPPGSDVQIPAGTKTPVIVGRVILVGPGKYENGSYVPIEIAEDDYVVVGAYSGIDFEINSILHTMVTSDDVKAKYTTT